MAINAFDTGMLGAKERRVGCMTIIDLIAATMTLQAICACGSTMTADILAGNPRRPSNTDTRKRDPGLFL